MNQEQFKLIVSTISATLRTMQSFGEPISNDFIEEIVEKELDKLKVLPTFEYEDTDVKRLKFVLRNMFNISVDHQSIVLGNPDAVRWLDSKKSKISWDHWNAYKEMLLSQARATEVIEKNEEVIDQILDLSSDPNRPEKKWARKGLVMGNVQSGKTQNYLGLINKGMDAGYKVIILLGGHLVDLRKQTQERVDEGVLGRESRHLIENSTKKPAPIGVGLHGGKNVNAGTTTLADFNKGSAQRLGITLSAEGDPFIFTIKKQTKVMDELYHWIINHHFLDPENGKKMEVPLLLIDDEADYASINTKHHKEEVTKTNDAIRKLLSLFNKNTYVGYTATPFANIFIDPDENTYSEEDDLFPSDFMIKLPTPSNYMGQDFFFRSDSQEMQLENESVSPVVEINDHWPIFELKKTDQITMLPETLKQAIRAFVIVIAIRSLRGENTSHNTMLVNVSHLRVHQDSLEFLIEQYKQNIFNALQSFSGLSLKESNHNSVINDLMTTFNDVFEVPEDFDDVYRELFDSVGKIKVQATNQGANALDYSSFKEFGLNIIIIGGHKLSRGLTLEGLSISYFARNSKAYDTLMQMCRWFGYRPNYSDLCKLYLPTESLEWYSFIALAINELYSELELMAKARQRPKDFGLKVREHPGAMMITAKNKIGFAQSEVRSQSLWGQVQRRFSFYSSKEKNDRNLVYAEQFVQKLFDKTINYKDSENNGDKPYIFEDVEYSELIDFVRNIDLPEDDLGNDALIHHLKGMQEAGLPKVKVALYTQANLGKTQWEDELTDEQDKKFINSKFLFCKKNIAMPKRAMKLVSGDLYQIPSVNLGNPDDEKIFLSPSAIDKVKERCGDKKPLGFDYIASDERDFPGLIIYLFAVAIKNPWGKKSDHKDRNVYLGHGQKPTLGFSVSLPRAEEIKNKSNDEIKKILMKTRHSYQINKVFLRNKSIFEYADQDDYDE